MKTAKDIADRCLLHIEDGEEYSFSPDEFQAFARQLCKEQRDLCVEYGFVHHFMPNEPEEERVRLAPEPEFQ